MQKVIFVFHTRLLIYIRNKRMSVILGNRHTIVLLLKNLTRNIGVVSDAEFLEKIECKDKYITVPPNKDYYVYCSRYSSNSEMFQHNSDILEEINEVKKLTKLGKVIYLSSFTTGLVGYMQRFCEKNSVFGCSGKGGYQ